MFYLYYISILSDSKNVCNLLRRAPLLSARSTFFQWLFNFFVIC